MSLTEWPIIQGQLQHQISTLYNVIVEKQHYNVDDSPCLGHKQLLIMDISHIIHQSSNYHFKTQKSLFVMCMYLNFFFTKRFPNLTLCCDSTTISHAYFLRNYTIFRCSNFDDFIMAKALHVYHRHNLSS